MKDWTVEQLMEFVKSQTTDDGRIAPDYAESFELKRIIDELAERAWMYEELQ
mgnify:CR=1 FL=1